MSWYEYKIIQHKYKVCDLYSYLEIVGISCYGDQIYCKIYVKNYILIWALLMSFQLANDLSRVESLVQGIRFKADVSIVVVILGGWSFHSLVLAQNLDLY